MTCQWLLRAETLRLILSMSRLLVVDFLLLVITYIIRRIQSQLRSSFSTTTPIKFSTKSLSDNL